MHKSFIVRRTWVLTLDLSLGQKEIDSFQLLMDIETSAAQQERNNLMGNLTIVYAIVKRSAAAAVRYLIIFTCFFLHLSWWQSMRSIRKQNIVRSFHFCHRDYSKAIAESPTMKTISVWSFKVCNKMPFRCIKRIFRARHKTH